MRIKLNRFAFISPTPNTTWVFAEISDDEANYTTVEVGSRAAADALKGLAQLLSDEDIDDEAHISDMLGLGEASLRTDITVATAVSGLRTATAQLQAMRADVALSEFLGAPRQSNQPGQPESVELYANINRALFATRRTPDDFVRMAARAVDAGFSTIKCAPFDEVRPPSSPSRILDDASLGLARVRAVRNAIGPEIGLLVDCHSRFERDTAPLIVEELAKLEVGWFEEPVQPTTNSDDLAEIARWAPMPVAGGEAGYGVEFFDELLESGAASIVMPDIKYCGGAVEVVEIGRRAEVRDRGFSIHSPSGPISLLASGHATAAVPNSMPLEHAVYETAWRAELIDPPERVEGGRLWLPSSAGLGTSVNWDILERFGRVWKP